MTLQDLNQQLLQAHENVDVHKLAELYKQAGDLSESSGDADAACFFLTQAYVFALECGSESAPSLKKRLVIYGRL